MAVAGERSSEFTALRVLNRDQLLSNQRRNRATFRSPDYFPAEAGPGPREEMGAGVFGAIGPFDNPRYVLNRWLREPGAASSSASSSARSSSNCACRSMPAHGGVEECWTCTSEAEGWYNPKRLSLRTSRMAGAPRSHPIPGAENVEPPAAPDQASKGAEEPPAALACSKESAIQKLAGVPGFRPEYLVHFCKREKPIRSLGDYEKVLAAEESRRESRRARARASGGPRGREEARVAGGGGLPRTPAPRSRSPSPDVSLRMPSSEDGAPSLASAAATPVVQRKLWLPSPNSSVASTPVHAHASSLDLAAAGGGGGDGGGGTPRMGGGAGLSPLKGLNTLVRKAGRKLHSAFRPRANSLGGSVASTESTPTRTPTSTLHLYETSLSRQASRTSTSSFMTDEEVLAAGDEGAAAAWVMGAGASAGPLGVQFNRAPSLETWGVPQRTVVL